MSIWRVHCFDCPPEGETAIWPDSFWLWDVNTGQCVECGPTMARLIPRRYRLSVEEISLVSRPADPFAKIAMFK
jgi:hypothetical protein